MVANPTGGAADVRQWRVAPFDEDAIERFNPQFYYRRATDQLFLGVYGLDRPSVGWVIDDNFTVRIDPTTSEFLGIEIGHFLSEAVLAHPKLLPLLDLPGIPAQEAAKIRRQAAGVPEEHVTVADVFRRLVRQIL